MWEGRHERTQGGEMEYSPRHDGRLVDGGYPVAAIFQRRVGEDVLGEDF